MRLPLAVRRAHHAPFGLSLSSLTRRVRLSRTTASMRIVPGGGRGGGTLPCGVRGAGAYADATKSASISSAASRRRTSAKPAPRCVMVPPRVAASGRGRSARRRAAGLWNLRIS